MDASGKKESARRPDPTLIPVDLGWLPAPLWPQLHTHLPHSRKERWTTSKVSVDLGLVRPAFLPGAVQTGSLLEAGPFRPCLITTPALPYPILFTLFSFRMKKAGIDLPLRQFQGTLDPLKCLSV